MRGQGQVGEGGESEVRLSLSEIIDVEWMSRSKCFLCPCVRRRDCTTGTARALQLVYLVITRDAYVHLIGWTAAGEM